MIPFLQPRSKTTLFGATPQSSRLTLETSYAGCRTRTCCPRYNREPSSKPAPTLLSYERDWKRATGGEQARRGPRSSDGTWQQSAAELSAREPQICTGRKTNLWTHNDLMVCCMLYAVCCMLAFRRALLLTRNAHTPHALRIFLVPRFLVS